VIRTNNRLSAPITNHKSQITNRTRRVLLATVTLLFAVAADRSDISFPRDHGAHRNSAIEWWYYTGHLQDPSGREYGFQLTFFRVRELSLAHFAWSDVARKTFRYEEKTHLILPGIAAAEEGRLSVSNESWSAEESGGTHRLRAAGRGWELSLALRAAKPPVLNGEDGVSRKGPGAEDYSRYVSITRLEASGQMRNGSVTYSLSGTAWFDHEWGPGGMPAGVAGWDWFALQLADGSELMLYRMRANSGGATPFSSGTFVSADGSSRPILWRDVILEESAWWKSARSGARYPARWRIAVESLGLDVVIQPLLPDQELATEQSTGVIYWEGACLVEGRRQGRPVAGRAYAELTGYAGRDITGMGVDGSATSPAPPRATPASAPPRVSTSSPSPRPRASR
jgi:predicted secreted hydrolase